VCAFHGGGCVEERCGHGEEAVGEVGDVREKAHQTRDASDGAGGVGWRWRTRCSGYTQTRDRWRRRRARRGGVWQAPTRARGWWVVSETSAAAATRVR